jgi:alpha-L-fucosidase 2
MHTPEPLIWNTPSRDSSGSMPLGNGDIGLNVWVEENGDLLFYLSKTDAWDENARLLKLGRIRVSLSPNPFAAGAAFRQELDLARGCVHISGEVISNQSSVIGCGTLNTEHRTPITVALWVDANRPVARVEIESARPIEAQVTLELWRTVERRREGAEGGCDAGLRSPDERETVYPDTVLDGGPSTLLWCHRNQASCWAATLEHQDMADWVQRGHDPLLNRTFGALLRGVGLVRASDRVLRTKAPHARITFAIHLLTAQTDTLEQWTAALRAQVARTNATAAKTAFIAHTAWWQSFWQRSWIRVSGTPEAEMVSRGYELQRFVNACGGRGAFPIKFNGSIFTVDAREKDEVVDADYRRWGGGYWFQNTRLTYWPMIMSGDFDLMEPWFRMYLDALPFAIARAKANFGLENAAMFPETMTFWGAFLNSNYGYKRGELAPGLSENRYIRRYWQGMLELLAVLLDLYAVTEDDAVLRDKLLVLAPPFLRFYRDYYAERDRNGKMRIAPSQSLETWHEAVNPSPDIAGLQWVLDGLLALPEGNVPEALRAEWRAFRQILPPLPTRHYVWENRTEIIPAVEYDQCANSENPELYAVFPYRLFGVGKPDLNTGLATWHARRVKDTGGWRQDAIQAALLGLTDEAKRDVVKNFSTPHAGSRFPAFWGPNHDWIPDQDHGSAACIALQRMLMQWDLPEPVDATPSSRVGGSGVGAASTTGAKRLGGIRLLPAWPNDWSVDFKLHAPGKTVVEGSARDGHLTELRVTPKARRLDVVLT